MGESVSANKSVHWDSIDVLKFVLSILIVVIHVNPFSSIAYDLVTPVLRTAVPLFFMISSFFFFRKLTAEKSVALEERGGALLGRLFSFTKRNMQLYLFWLIVLLVPTLIVRGWFDSGFLLGLFKMIHSFVFSSTFVASWFIVALVIGVWVVAILSLKLGNRSLLLLSIPIYVVCVLMSNYYYSPFTQSHLDALNYAFYAPYNSFWASFLWVVLGKMVADSQVSLSMVPAKKLAVAFFVGIMLLYTEQFVVIAFGFAGENDAFFSLPFVCLPVFILVLGIRREVKCAGFLRSASTVIYCVHGTARGVFAAGFSFHGVEVTNVLLLPVVMCFSLGCALIIFLASRNRKLKWLRYAY